MPNDLTAKLPITDLITKIKDKIILSKRPPAEHVAFSKSKDCRRQSLQKQII